MKNHLPGFFVEIYIAQLHEIQSHPADTDLILTRYQTPRLSSSQDRCLVRRGDVQTAKTFRPPIRTRHKTRLCIVQHQSGMTIFLGQRYL